jgi:hypothetical protein
MALAKRQAKKKAKLVDSDKSPAEKNHIIRKLGKPNFHSIRNSNMSYTTDKPKFENNKIHLPKIG